MHTLELAAMEAADQHIRSSLEFSILPKDTSTFKPEESNQLPSVKKMQALPLSHSHQLFINNNTLPELFLIALFIFVHTILCLVLL